MKARKIYENIEFERGKDPKTALGIGKLAQNPVYHYPVVPFVNYAGKKPDDKKMLKNASRMLGVPKGDVLVVLEKDLGDDYWYPLEQETIKELYDNKNIIRKKKIRTDEHGNVTEMHQADSGEIYTIVKGDWNEGDDWSFFDEVLAAKKPLQESIEFERGKDPKSSLGIGQLHHIEEVMRNFANKYGLTEVHSYEYDPRLSDDPDPKSSGQMIAKWVDGYGKQLILYIDDKKKPPSGDNIRVYWQKAAGFDDSTPADQWLDEDSWRYFLDINESYNFQRGRNPKESLEIGAVSAIDRMAKKHGLKEIEDKQAADEIVEPSYMDDVIKVWGTVDDSPWWRGEVTVVLLKYNGELIIGADNGVESIDKPWDYFLKDSAWNELLHPDPTNESVSFERGREPYSSLGIGKQRFESYRVEDVLDALSKKAIKSMKKMMETRDVYYLGDSSYHEYPSHFSRLEKLIKNKEPVAEETLISHSYRGRDGEFDEYDVIAIWDTPIGKIGNISPDERMIGDTWFGDLQAASELGIDKLNIL